MLCKIKFKEIIAFIVMVSLIIILYPQKQINSHEVAYLQKNVQHEISLNEQDLQSKKAFIVSELHGFKENTLIRYKFLSYLNDNRGINVYLGEISFSSGYLLNEYLQTGNILLLDKVFSFYKGSTFCTEEEYQFYQDLYKYNQNINNQKKITLYGIDIEHSLESALYFYNYYTKTNINDINQILNAKYFDPLLIHLQNNIHYYHVFYPEYNFQKRDNFMYHNYLFLHKHYQIDCFFSQLGAKHSFLDITSDKYRSFAYYLNHSLDSPLKGKVLSIHTFYKDSAYIEAYKFKQQNYYKEHNIKRTYQTNNLDCLNNKWNLINLEEENSPFNQSLVWYNLESNNLPRKTTDYYQYLLLINNSTHANPLDNFVKADN